MSLSERERRVVCSTEAVTALSESQLSKTTLEKLHGPL